MHFQTMLYVIFPQTLRNIIPQIGNNLIINIKDSLGTVRNRCYRAVLCGKTDELELITGGLRQ